MKRTLFAAMISMAVMVAILIFCFILANAQDTWDYGEMPSQEDVRSPDVDPYIYDGWQDNTTLRSNTFDAGERPPQPNERLYIYEDGVKKGGYYQYDGYGWKPRNGAYTTNTQQGEEE